MFQGLDQTLPVTHHNPDIEIGPISQRHSAPQLVGAELALKPSVAKLKVFMFMVLLCCTTAFKVTVIALRITEKLKLEGICHHELCVFMSLAEDQDLNQWLEHLMGGLARKGFLEMVSLSCGRDTVLGSRAS